MKTKQLQQDDGREYDASCSGSSSESEVGNQEEKACHLSPEKHADVETKRRHSAIEDVETHQTSEQTQPLPTSTCDFPLLNLLDSSSKS